MLTSLFLIRCTSPTTTILCQLLFINEMYLLYNTIIINKTRTRDTVDSIKLHCRDGCDAVLLIITIASHKIDKRLQQRRYKKNCITCGSCGKPISVFSEMQPSIAARATHVTRNSSLSVLASHHTISFIIV